MSQGPIDQLAESRAAFERRLEELRDALGSELGRKPRRRRWALPLAAAAGGLALAWRVVARVRSARLAARREIEVGSGDREAE